MSDIVTEAEVLERLCEAYGMDKKKVVTIPQFIREMDGRLQGKKHEGLTLDEYQAGTRTSVTSPYEDVMLNAMFWLMCLSGEVGELQNKFKRMIRTGDINEQLIKDEAGDVLWYWTTFLDTFEFKPGEVAAYNLQKLRSRLVRNPEYYAVKDGRSTYDDAHSPKRPEQL